MRGLGSAALAAARLFGGIEKGKLQGAQRAREEVNARKAEADAEQRAMLDEMVKRSTVGRNEAETAEQLRATSAAPKTFAEMLEQQAALHPQQPRNIDPSSPEGIAAAARRAAATAAAEQPYKERQARVSADASAEGRTRGAPTEFERKAAMLAPRAEEANKTIDQYGAPPPSSLLGRVTFGNYGLTGDQEKLNHASEVLATAVLRLESGAAISKEEIKSYGRQLTPQPGDSPALIAQKKKNREIAVKKLREAAGRANEMGGADPIRIEGKPSQSSDDLYKKYGIEPRRP